MDENQVRAEWREGAPCQIYSNSKREWFPGKVASIFTDREGEWLQVRYDKSMSKQVQRYSSDIRPHPDDMKKPKKPKKSKDNVPFPDEEMKLRQSWGKGDEVEIFSNTHQEWYLGEINGICKDEEGEWLTCVWARSNGEAMSKQVQRFSTDVRPVQDDSSEPSSSGSTKQSREPNKPLTAKEKVESEVAVIQARRQGFRRKAPPFSRTLRASTWTYPATSSARRQRKLPDLEEQHEKNQHVIDRVPGLKDKRSSNKKPTKDISSMKPPQVREFIRSLGSAYEPYVKKFKCSGSQLIMWNESRLQKIVGVKLHRHRILMEIARNTPNRSDNNLFDHDVAALHWDSAKVRQWCRSNQATKSHADKFFNHGVDGMLLFELDSKDLAAIGVYSRHQQKVLECIAQFANDTFPAETDDAKDEEPGKVAMNGNAASKGHGRRASVSAHEMNGAINGLIAGGSNQNNDAIIFTMGQLLLELGEMFKVGKVQDLTSILKRQLDELQSNSNHPQMARRKSQGNKPAISEGDDDDDNELDDERPNGKVSDKTEMLKRGDRVDSAPSGVDTAWLNTQTGKQGHRRRDSVTFLNPNQLDDDEDDSISDIE